MATRYLPTPKVKLDRSSDAIHRVASITGLSADLDLRTVSGKPRFCPQRTILSAATALTAVMVTEDDESLTVVVPANNLPLVLDRPIKTLVQSTSGAVQAIMQWWESPSSQNRNP